MSDDSNEALKAISARIGVALGLLEKGSIADARCALRRMLSILPDPGQNNIEAALEDLKD